ncbi:MAG TPA: hypothetical protein VLM85_18825, partial [Polyangiaceae bacterium]|nr:hypothetical protein [Polyangiaceae bacterium]
MGTNDWLSTLVVKISLRSVVRLARRLEQRGGGIAKRRDAVGVEHEAFDSAVLAFPGEHGKREITP